MSAATDNLRDHQQQLDMDGVIVGVSRQAIHETLEQYAEMLAALKAVEQWWLDEGKHRDCVPNAIFATREAIAKAEKPDG